MKISIKTLGCKVNQAESAYIEGAVRKKGHEVVNGSDSLDASQERPDICIINTCTVTAKSDYQSRQMIRKAVRSGAKVIATGCYAQTRPDELLKIKGIDLIAGNSEKHRLHEYIDKFPSGNNVMVGSPEVSLTTGPYFSGRSRAFLKIQDGCNFSCSYCIVPMARGKSRSLAGNKVLNEAGRFVKDGFKEIVLTGIHIGSYGLDLKPESSLIDIVKKIAGESPNVRIRLSSLEPREFKRGFLDLMGKGAVCPHLHIPLQSGSDKTLKAMNRGYSTSFYKKLLDDIVSARPDISIGTDIIAGFPGETEKDFKETLEFLKELPLSYVHAFPYSKRPNTRAVSMKDHLSNEIKKHRVSQILEYSNIRRKDHLNRQLGEKLDVIVEQKGRTGGFYRAISDNYIRLLVRADSLLPGQRLEVTAASISNNELICTTM